MTLLSESTCAKAVFQLTMLLCLVSKTSYATNLVTNPGFDTSTGWYTYAPDVIVFDGSDGQPPPSGSLTTLSASSISFASSECIPITEGRADLSFDIKIQSGVGGIAVTEYSDGSCSTYIGSTSDLLFNTGLSSWTPLSLFDFPLPAGTNSAIVELRIGPNAGDISTPSSSFDNVSFGATDDIFKSDFD
jgi:hypothetical protein